ncbi:MAG: DUF6306 domain-containing protein [bacterium]
MDNSELAQKLRTLIEAERAGVFVARALLEEVEDPDYRSLLVVILDGERDSCRLLGRMIMRLGENSGGVVGDFHEKVMALDDDAERLRLLIKGQDWVVRKVDELLDGDLESSFAEDLNEMKRVHVVNIDLCKQYLGSLT